ncbi:MAG: YceI family protein [Flavobacteriaceae bacterium]
MKKIVFVLAVFAFVATSCKNDKKQVEKPVTKTTKTKVVHKDEVTWKGYKPTGSHYGTISIKNTNLKIADNVLSGSAIIDMASIINNDLKDPKYNGDLVGHLKGKDFFEVEKYPTAKFEVTKSSSDKLNVHDVEGNITIKGVTKKIKFQGKTAVNENGDTVLRGNFKIDRTDFGIKYKSTKFFDNLKDKFINDKFDLGVKIKLAK